MTAYGTTGGPSPIGAGLIGIVSGLGPLAGSDVLDKALAYAATKYGAVEDADYPDIVLFSHGIESFDSTGSIEDNFVDELVTVVEEIDLHHPTVLGVACNTAHLHLSELRKHTRALAPVARTPFVEFKPDASACGLGATGSVELFDGPQRRLRPQTGHDPALWLSLAEAFWRARA